MNRKSTAKVANFCEKKTHREDKSVITQPGEFLNARNNKQVSNVCMKAESVELNSCTSKQIDIIPSI